MLRLNLKHQRDLGSHFALCHYTYESKQLDYELPFADCEAETGMVFTSWVAGPLIKFSNTSSTDVLDTAVFAL